MELDLLLPKLELSFEFQVCSCFVFCNILMVSQDIYHYVSTWYYQNPQADVRLRDDITSLWALDIVFCFDVLKYKENNSTATRIKFSRGSLLVGWIGGQV